MGERVLVIDNYRQTLSIVRSLSLAGYEITLGCLHGKRVLAEHSRHVKEIWYHPPQNNEYRFIAALGDFLATHPEISMILPVGEVTQSVLARHDFRPPHGCEMLMTESHLLLTCIDKIRSNSTAKDLNIPVPKSFTVKSCQQLRQAVEEIGCPCIVKPSNSLLPFFGQKALTVESGLDLDRYFSKWPTGLACAIVQQKINGPRFSCSFAAVDGKILCIFETVALRVDTVNSTGNSVDLLSVPVSDERRRYTEAMVKKLNYTGVGMTQFLHCPETKLSYFIEINPRLGGSVSLAIHCGADFPKFMVEILGSHFSSSTQQSLASQTFALGKRCHWLSGDIQGLLHALNHRELGLGALMARLAQMINSFIWADCHIIWSWRDPLPTLVLASTMLGSAFSRTYGMVSAPRRLRINRG